MTKSYTYCDHDALNLEARVTCRVIIQTTGGRHQPAHDCMLEAQILFPVTVISKTVRGTAT